MSKIVEKIKALNEEYRVNVKKFFESGDKDAAERAKKAALDAAEIYDNLGKEGADKK